MTTSYSEDTSTTSSSGQPKKDSKGHLSLEPLCWALSYEPAAKERESYGGICWRSTGRTGSCRQSLQKHIHITLPALLQQSKTLQQASNLPPVHPGPDPGGGQLDPDGDSWIEINSPEEGNSVV